MTVEFSTWATTRMVISLAKLGYEEKGSIFEIEDNELGLRMCCFWYRNRISGWKYLEDR